MTKFTTEQMIDLIIGKDGEVDSLRLAIIARLKAADALLSAAKDVANTHLGIEEWLNQMEMLRKAIKSYEEA